MNKPIRTPADLASIPASWYVVPAVIYGVVFAAVMMALAASDDTASPRPVSTAQEPSPPA